MVIVVSVLAVFYLGLFPSAILDFAQSSAFLAR